jgi:hypothetical protein
MLGSKKHRSEWDDDARDRKNQTRNKRARDTDFYNTDERRANIRAYHDRKAKEVTGSDLVRANHQKLVAEMQLKYPLNWKQHIVAIMTVEQVHAKVSSIEATPLNQLKSLHKALFEGIDAPVGQVLNGQRTMSYIGLCGPAIVRECPAPPGKAIRLGKVARLRWNCSGAVRLI